MKENIELKHNRLYKSDPQICRSPCRIDLIGEHTDYNNGFVLPASVDKKICFAIALNSLELYRLYSIKYDYYPFHTDDQLVILMNSGIKYSLTTSECNVMHREFGRKKSAHSEEGLVQVPRRIRKTEE